MKRFRYSFKKSLLFLILLLVVIEAVAQLMGLGDPPLVELDDQIEYMLVPNKNYMRFGNAIEINEYRMRSAPFEFEKQPGELRVLLFGDSIVYGNHHIDQADTIASNLEKLIASKNEQTVVSVGSVAASSWGPSNILAFVERFGTFNGDVAILVLSSHDILDVPTFSQNIIPYRITGSLSASHDLLQILVERIRRRIVVQQLEPPEKRRTATLKALNKLITVLKKDFSSILFLYHPNRAQNFSCENDVKKTYEQISKMHEIKFDDLCKNYKEAENRGVSIYQDDIHLSREGTQVISLAIANYLKNL